MLGANSDERIVIDICLLESIDNACKGVVNEVESLEELIGKPKDLSFITTGFLPNRNCS